VARTYAVADDMDADVARLIILPASVFLLPSLL